MNKIDYDKRMREILEEERGKRLLLHSCCAPCSSYCLEEVGGVMKTTVFYYNPNLDGEEEYEKRKAEQIRLLRETGLADYFDCGYDHAEFLAAAKGLADYFDCGYDHAEFLAAAKGLEGEKEGGARCKECFYLRLSRTAREAKARGFDFFATTLTLSPLKNAALINEIGLALQEEYGVKYLPTDFKKRGGYLRSIELSKQYSLYRQNYCGCEFSKR